MPSPDRFTEHAERNLSRMGQSGGRAAEEASSTHTGFEGPVPTLQLRVDQADFDRHGLPTLPVHHRLAAVAGYAEHRDEDDLGMLLQRTRSGPL